MKNKKSIFFRIVCLLMIFCTSFVFVGCMGMDPDELKEYESELAGGDYDPFDEDSLDFTMYGTKVLYRPEGYDYNAGSGGTEENPNDYYGQYAWVILNDLFNIYGIVLDTDEEDPYESRLEAFDSDKSNLPYLYDSIRYQVDTVGQVTNQVNEDGTDTGTEVNYTIVGADLSSKWNWSFNYVWPNVEGSLMDTAYKILDNHLYNINSETMNDAKSAIISHYTDATKNIGDKYQSIYLGTTSQTDYDNYSPYVKALEYAIYSYALDLEPAQVQITYASTGDVPYSVKIGNVAVDNALANIKQLFNQAGSYVGLTTRQAEKLKVWILNNVIGSSAQDDFTTYANVTEVVGDDGKTVVGYEFGTGTTVNLGRDYENAVDRIVEGVCSQVTIGNADGDGDGKIQDNFLASEIMEYAGNTFMIAGDENFPSVAESGGSKYAIKPLEYQSVTLMLKEETTIDGIYIALKYDADEDGTEDGVWNLDKYLDIIVELNFYSHSDNELYTIGSQKARVYDGPFDISYNHHNMYEDFGNVYFYDWASKCNDDRFKAHLDDDNCLVVNKFNIGIGGNALMTDVGTDGGYTKAPIISNNPLVLVGSSPARRYYTLLEPGENEDLEGKTYITGRLNPEKFSGSDGCDYLEITYKVLKDHQSDTSKNYKFYTGISFIY